MAPTATQVTHEPNVGSVEKLYESSTSFTVPSVFTPAAESLSEAISKVLESSIPVFDMTLLTTGDPEQRSEAIEQLGKYCQEWGFFLVINHGVPENMMKETIDVCQGFFVMTEEEKKSFDGKELLDPIRCGTNSTSLAKDLFMWREYVKFFSHPEFHCPTKPSGFSVTTLEFTKRTREVARELMGGVLESLGVEEGYMDKALHFDKGLQMFAANLYPICPNPDQAIGIPPHTDHGFLTLLINNGIPGLQILHQGKWVNVQTLPNSYVVNVGDQLEIVSNGKYKSIYHRALVNEKVARVSIAMAHGPGLDTVVGVAPTCVDDNNPPLYRAVTYKAFLETQHGRKHRTKATLEIFRVGYEDN